MFNLCQGQVKFKCCLKKNSLCYASVCILCMSQSECTEGTYEACRKIESDHPKLPALLLIIFDDLFMTGSPQLLSECEEWFKRFPHLRYVFCSWLIVNMLPCFIFPVNKGGEMHAFVQLAFYFILIIISKLSLKCFLKQWLNWQFTWQQRIIKNIIKNTTKCTEFPLVNPITRKWLSLLMINNLYELVYNFVSLIELLV